jgi:hypothetical protein
LVLVVLAVLCVCAVSIGVAGVALLGRVSGDDGGGIGQTSERLEESFEVGAAPRLTVENFTGDVTILAGESGLIRVAAIKKASSSRNLERIEVTMKVQGDGVLVRARKTSAFLGAASVKFEITAPTGTRLDLNVGTGDATLSGLTGGTKVNIGTGDLDARDLVGEVEVDIGTGDATVAGTDVQVQIHSGTGDISVRGASGPARLDVGTGDIEYEGDPQGDCRFETGTGGIRLALPDDLDARVDLDTGTGSIDVDFDVTGRASRREVKGVIGRGDGESVEASIYARTGTGSIDLIRR